MPIDQDEMINSERLYFIAVVAGLFVLMVAGFTGLLDPA
jgi:hypothetical protein